MFFIVEIYSSTFFDWLSVNLLLLRLLVFYCHFGLAILTLAQSAYSLSILSLSYELQISYNSKVQFYHCFLFLQERGRFFVLLAEGRVAGQKLTLFHFFTPIFCVNPFFVYLCTAKVAVCRLQLR